MKVRKKDNKFIFETEFSTLEEYADLTWASREYKHPQVRKDQIQYWCLDEDKNELIVLRTVPDSRSLRDRVIEHDVQTNSNLGMGMAVLGMFDNDEPLEPRWKFMGDYELVGFSGDLPIVKRKNNE